MTARALPPMPPGVSTDRPCPKYHDGTIKRLAVPARVRRAVALRYGGVPGATIETACQYCGAAGVVFWPALSSGVPGSWVTFGGLHLEHVYPYSRGGSNTDADNFVLSCKSCNSSKGNRFLDVWVGAVS